jgi:hypothetical protein
MRNRDCRERRNIYNIQIWGSFHYMFSLFWLVIQETHQYKSTMSTHKTDVESWFVVYILHSILLNMVRSLLYLSTSFLHLKDAQSSQIPPLFSPAKVTFCILLETTTEPVHEENKTNHPMGIAMQSLMLRRNNKQAIMIKTRHAKTCRTKTEKKRKDYAIMPSPSIISLRMSLPGPLRAETSSA